MTHPLSLGLLLVAAALLLVVVLPSRPLEAGRSLQRIAPRPPARPFPRPPFPDGATDVDQGSSGSRRSIPGDGDPPDAALELGERFGAHVTALHLIAEPFMRNMAGYHLPADILKEHMRQAEAEAEQVFAQAREAADHRGISLETRTESGSLDRIPALFARNARNTDLVIVGEPNPEAGGADETLLVEAAFMDTGRPALVIPQAGAVKLPPERIMIAWDGSREAARAVHDSMPLLRLAEEVVILIVDATNSAPASASNPAPASWPISAATKWHPASPKSRAAVAAITDLILAEATSNGADLIVMGGYGHSRLRELMLGGATRHMIERMTCRCCSPTKLIAAHRARPAPLIFDVSAGHLWVLPDYDPINPPEHE